MRSYKRIAILIAFLAGVTLSAYLLQSYSQGVDFFGPVGGKLSFFYLSMISMVLLLLAHFIRAWQFGLFIRTLKPSSLGVMLEGTAIGYFFNALLPIRAGELIRGLWIADRMKMSKGAVLILIGIERTLDLCTVVVLSAFGYFIFSGRHLTLDSEGVLILFFSLAATGVFSASLIYLFCSQPKWLLRAVWMMTSIFNVRIKNRLRFSIWSVFFATQTFFKNIHLAKILLANLVKWTAYMASMYLLVSAFASWDFTANFLASSLSFLVLAIPSEPEFLVNLQTSFTGILNSVIGPTPYMNQLVFMIWFVQIVPTSLIGFAIVLLNKWKSDDLIEKENIQRNKLSRGMDISTDLSSFLDDYFSGSELMRIAHQMECKSSFRVVETFRGGSQAITLLGLDTESKLKSVRKICLNSHADKLRAQAKWLKDRHHFSGFPKVIRELVGPTYYSIDIQYENGYETLFEFIHQNEVSVSRDVLTRILAHLESTIYQHALPEVEKRELMEEYIQTKLIKKVEDSALLDPAISQLLTFDDLIINGKKVINFSAIMSLIMSRDDIMSDLIRIREVEVHGDLTAENILVNKKNEFIVIDPNNENLFSAPVVDIAKLFQSLHSGYEFLLQNKKMSIFENSIHFAENLSSQYREIHSSLLDKLSQSLSPYEYRSLLFHEAIHFSRMLPYRIQRSPEIAPLFFGICVRLLNEFYEQYPVKNPSIDQAVSL